MKWQQLPHTRYSSTVSRAAANFHYATPNITATTSTACNLTINAFFYYRPDQYIKLNSHHSSNKFRRIELYSLTFGRILFRINFTNRFTKGFIYMFLNEKLGHCFHYIEIITYRSRPFKDRSWPVLVCMNSNYILRTFLTALSKYKRFITVIALTLNK